MPCFFVDLCTRIVAICGSGVSCVAPAYDLNAQHFLNTIPDRNVALVTMSLRLSDVSPIPAFFVAY